MWWLDGFPSLGLPYPKQMSRLIGFFFKKIFPKNYSNECRGI